MECARPSGRLSSDPRTHERKSHMQRKGFFARLADVWRGFWGVRVSQLEVQNAEAVYYQAIRERERHQQELKTAAARLVYLRNRTEAQLQQAKTDHALVTEALRR